MSEELEEEVEQEEVVEKTEEEQSQEEYDKVFFGEEETEEVEEESDSPEVDSETEEETEEEDDTIDEEEPQPEQDQSDDDMVTLKWRGKEIRVSQQEAINMAQQNFDVTAKYQEVAKLRKNSESDLDLLKRVRDGDKEALAMLSKQSGIDPVDLLDIEVDDIEQGKPDQEEPFMSEQVASMMDEVAKDDALFNEMSEVERMLPSAVVSKMAKDPETFYAIINEVRSGDAGRVMPYLQARLSQLDDLDRSVVMNDTDAFASFYGNVKNSLIQESTQRQAPEKKPVVNHAKVSVQKSNTSKRGTVAKQDSMSSDAAYEKILERLNSQQ